MKILSFILSAVSCFMLVALISSPVAGQGSERVSLEINERQITFPDQQPFIDENHRVMVPVRFVSEELGAAVNWKPQSQTIMITDEQHIIELTLHSSAVKVNGVAQQLDTKTVLSDHNRAMVPLRFVSELLGRSVTWHPDLQTVRITDQRLLGPSIESAETINKACYAGEKVNTKVLLENLDENPQPVWLGHSLKSPTGYWYDVPAKSIDLKGNSSKIVDMNWEVPSDLMSGSYDAVFALWDKPPDEEGASRLYNFEKQDFYHLFNHIDYFETFPRDRWLKRDEGRLGLSKLLTDNVSIENNKLNIKLPHHSTDGGEIQTKEAMSFGSYEIKMKLPDASSSITGFFLYKEPDFYHEIDIEIFNDPTGKFLLTTYAEGSKQNEFQGFLPFDPTAKFNKYRIDYYPDKVAFFINDKLIKTWEEGYSKEPMRLMVNSWFPRWLDGEKHIEDKFLKVAWIRY